MYEYNFIRKSYIKTAEIIKTYFAAWRSTKNEVVSCTEIKDIDHALK